MNTFNFITSVVVIVVALGLLLQHITKSSPEDSASSDSEWWDGWINSAGADGDWETVYEDWFPASSAIVAGTVDLTKLTPDPGDVFFLDSESFLGSLEEDKALPLYECHAGHFTGSLTTLSLCPVVVSGVECRARVFIVGDV